MSTRIRLGLDLGQSIDSTALAVVEALPPPDDAPLDYRSQYAIRTLSRLPLGMTYPAIVEKVVGVVTRLQALGHGDPTVLVDATGVGAPVVDMLARPLAERANLRSVTIVSGDDYRLVADVEGRPQRLSAQSVRVGKVWLVSRLKALLQEGRVQGAPTPEFLALQAELRTFEVRAKGTRDTYNATSGNHDDLLIALGLSCLDEPQSDPGALEDLNMAMLRGPDILGWRW